MGREAFLMEQASAGKGHPLGGQRFVSIITSNIPLGWSCVHAGLQA